MQTKKQSFIESLTNTAVGFSISLAATFAVFPLVGINSSGGQNLAVTIFYTAISIARGYVIRRWFTKRHQL
jgi:hypothetical protein